MRSRIHRWVRTQVERLGPFLSPPLRRANLAREKLLLTSQLVHDIKGVLTAIYGSGVLIQQESSCEIAKTYGEQILKSTDYLNRMLEDILALNQAELGNLPVRPGPVVLRDELEEALQVYRLRCEKKKLRFELAFSPTVPAIVAIDGLRLIQIVTNLVSNAVKYTQEGTVRIELDHRDQQLVILVNDTGPGIPEAERRWVFSPYRPRKTPAHREGHGLGLGFARRIARILGGDLVLLPPTEKTGCRFRVTLIAPPV